MSEIDAGGLPDSEAFRCGTVALVGRPNAGKSTLMNKILGSKLAITSAKPQTTRNRIVGIHSDERCQLVLLDTPGIHEAWTELNKHMVRRAQSVLEEVDVACWIVDMTGLARRIEQQMDVLGEDEERMAAMFQAANVPLVLVANKIDVVPRPLFLPVIDAVQTRLPLTAAVPVSALTGDGVDGLVGALAQAVPPGPHLYPPEQWAQVTERFLVAEIVREKIFHLTSQEVPYCTFVAITQFDESDRETRGLTRILADIVVERESQKGIVIGRGGEMLKRIGTLARRELQSVLDCKVYLELFVRVEKDWTRSARGLRKVGFEA